MSPLKYALWRLKRYKKEITVAIFWSILFVIIPMQIPILTGSLIDGINGDSVKPYGIITLDESKEEILQFSIIGLIIVAVAYGITAYFRTISKAKISRSFVFELQRKLAKKLEILSLEVHGRYGSGDLLNRSILDTQSVRPFVESTVIKTVVSVVRIIYPLVVLFTMEPVLAAMTSSILPLQFLLTRKLQKKMRKTARRVRKRRAKLTNFLKEDLDGIETIQTSNAESRSFRKISKQVNRVEEIELKTQKYSAMITGIAWGLTTAGLAMTWWYGGLQVLAGEMTIGTLVIFSSFVVFVYSPLRRFSEIMSVYNKSIVAVERIQEILDMPSPVRESQDAKPLHVDSGEIKFQNVSFSYDKNMDDKQDSENHSNKSVLHNVSLTIGPKGMTAIVGKSGSGKSSFLRLIPRLYDPQNDDGKIMIDGQDIKNVTLKSLRNEIAVVPQNPMMFSGTVYENVIMGRPDATKEQVKNACRAADAYDFIMNLEDDFDTVIGENDVSSRDNSVKLSQGQSQRITIARALLREPKILLLDEPTSALDMESEHKLFEMLNHLKDKITIMVIVHNLQLASIADKIVVVDNGIIDAIGTHSQLVSSPGIYQNLYTKGR